MIIVMTSATVIMMTCRRGRRAVNCVFGSSPATSERSPRCGALPDKFEFRQGAEWSPQAVCRDHQIEDDHRVRDELGKMRDDIWHLECVDVEMENWLASEFQPSGQ